MQDKRRLSKQSGFTLFETMAAIFMCSLLGLTIAGGLSFATKTRKMVELTNIARNLAVSKVEQLSALQTISLTSSMNSTEDNVIVPGHKIAFKRATAITVNSDNSRTVSVTVSSATANDHFPYPVNFTTTLAIWN